MIEPRNCCCCVPLRIGCLILGYLHLIASTILAVLIIIALVPVVEATSNTQVDQSAVAALIAGYVIVLILATLLLTFSLLLVIGIHKDRRSYVKAYLIYYSIFTVLYAIMSIVRIGWLIPGVGTEYNIIMILVFYIIGTLIQILLGVYSLLVIRSYWVTMSDNLNRA